MSNLLEAIVFARDAHGNQKYGDAPYWTHLESVARKLGDLLNRERGLMFFDHKIALSAAWLHDVLEDTATTQQAIRSEFGDAVAELVIAVTDEPGANRKERKSRTYPKIRTIGALAVALKLADRLANVRESRAHLDEGGAGLLNMYRDEQKDFHRALYRFEDGLDGAWNELSKLLVSP